MTSGNAAVAIIGPTASGKSALAGLLARRFGGEIVSCDALQIYRHMDIGTAKPTPAERQSIPHHMVDLRNPDQDFSAGEYQRLARVALRAIAARGRIPFVAGGTGFYLRALVDGLFEGPGRSEEIRARLRRIVRVKGPDYLHRRLEHVDPITAGRIDPADTARVIRAFEVYCLTGKTMAWWQLHPRDSLEGFRWLKLGISWPRDRLYERINLRVAEMYRQGFVEEVRWLAAHFPRECQAFKAIGYRQIISHLDGRIDLQQALADTQQETRRYAKRQCTWFRTDREITWLDAGGDFERVAEEASRLVAEHLQQA